MCVTRVGSARLSSTGTAPDSENQRIVKRSTSDADTGRRVSRYSHTHRELYDDGTNRRFGVKKTHGTPLVTRTSALIVMEEASGSHGVSHSVGPYFDLAGSQIARAGKYTWCRPIENIPP